VHELKDFENPLRINIAKRRLVAVVALPLFS
jgi:hypothetical protein